MDAETIRLRAEACKAIADKYGQGFEPFDDIIEELRATGATSDKVDTYVDQAVEQLGHARARARSQTLRSNEPTPNLMSPDEIADFRKSRNEAHRPRSDLAAKRAAEATEKAALDLLRAKVRAVRREDEEDVDELGSVLGVHKSHSGGIPESVLSAVPQLASLSAAVGDDHLQETFRLRRIFASDKALDPTIDLMQQQQLDVPIPHGLWKDIIQDRFVNFEKLFASMDVGYDHSEVPKDFHAGFVLVKKDQLVAKKALKSDGDWMRVFCAWETAVGLIYTHRVHELQRYKKQVMEMFQSDPDNPLAGIRFDAEVRERYAKNPFHMDDRNRTNTYMFSHMLRTSSKRPGSIKSSQSNPKRPSAICDNWNLGKCPDLCKWQRKHGVCSECGGKHQAQDNEACKTHVQAQSRARAASHSGTSS
jgi:hypothetical protein